MGELAGEVLSDEQVAARFDAEMREYVRRRQDAEEAEAEARQAKQALEEQKERIWDLLESAGMKTVNHELGRVTRSAIIKASVHDGEALARELDDLGLLDAFTKREFRKAELNAYVKEQIEQGQELPTGLDTYVERRITYTRPR